MDDNESVYFLALWNVVGIASAAAQFKASLIMFSRAFPLCERNIHLAASHQWRTLCSFDVMFRPPHTRILQRPCLKFPSTPSLGM